MQIAPSHGIYLFVGYMLGQGATLPKTKEELLPLSASELFQLFHSGEATQCLVR
jgi:hypothetical protein